MTTPSRTTSTFDRVRPRVASPDVAVATPRDAEGKRALFSTTEGDLPGAGSVTVECSRCGERTVLSPMAALRAAFPSLLLSIGFGHGDSETTVGVVRRQHGSFLRCPACRTPSWVRLTVRV
jgi:hypothetical protein